MINTAVGNEAGVTFNPRRKWDTKPRLLASVDRAKKLIGYQPNTPFPEGLQLIALKLAFGVEIL